ncbi:MAG: hypothetical protein IT337_09310 [Thermomicrobiales bacterium]|nr:hypothetical protein [Thermomicrobiales bacterium]
MSVYTESPSGLMVPLSRNGHLSESRHADALTIALLESRLGDLERQLQEEGWTRLDEQGAREFTRASLGRIIDLSRVMYLKNPLIRRAVDVGALYVWGQDLTVRAKDKQVEQVVNRFDEDNAATVTGQQASILLDVEKRVTGNVFLALFTNAITGNVKVRPVPVEEMSAIISNPEDRVEVWYYLRQWTEQPIAGGQVETRKALYPDVDYIPESKPNTLAVADHGDVEVRWDSPILHDKTGAFINWRWGVPETYPALDWARAYKEQLEDDATRSRALARFAWKLSTKGGRTGVAAAKTRLGTTYGTVGSGAETNPAPVAGSTFIQGEGVDLDPIRIAGATLDPEHSHPARLMVASAMGWPDTILSGDVDQGTLATAKSLDRPTELSVAEEREAWKATRKRLYQYAIDADLNASRGILPKSITAEQRQVDLSWPDILEPDVVSRVDSVAAAAPHLPDDLVTQQMMTALGVEDIDGWMQKMAAERAERERKAAEMAKQTQQQSPAPNEPPQPPVNQTEAKRTSESDIDAALAFFDSVAPEFSGLLDASTDGEDE